MLHTHTGRCTSINDYVTMRTHTHIYIYTHTLHRSSTKNYAYALFSRVNHRLGFGFDNRESRQEDKLRPEKVSPPGIDQFCDHGLVASAIDGSKSSNKIELKMFGLW